MKLLSIKLEDNLPYGLGNVSDVNMSEPPPMLRGWRISVRGPVLWLISPPGWEPANRTAPHERDPKGPSHCFRLSRQKVVERWEGVDSVDSPEKYDSPPMTTSEDRRQALAAEEALDKATAPGKVAK